MSISVLRMGDFRNLAAAELSPVSEGLNVIYGNNGSGKTSLLEAIHYLGLGRSFRSGNTAQLIRHSASKLTIFANLALPMENNLSLGMERGLDGSMRLRIAEKDAASLAEIASHLPTRVINTHSHQLLESGPSHRRAYLDWGLFYQQSEFLSCWRHFERVLKQRNALLKERCTKFELTCWSEELVKYATLLDIFRQQYIEQLVPFIHVATQSLLDLPALQISYFRGWDEAVDYAEKLDDSYLDEYRLGHTFLGPHRADLDIKIDGIPVKHFLSRGQQKLLVCAMILAQGMLLADQTNKRPIYLLDDLPAELDGQGRQKLISLLTKQKTQAFITAIEKETIASALIKETAVKMFHVEHGCVTNVPRGTSS